MLCINHICIIYTWYTLYIMSRLQCWQRVHRSLWSVISNTIHFSGKGWERNYYSRFFSNKTSFWVTFADFLVTINWKICGNVELVTFMQLALWIAQTHISPGVIYNNNNNIVSTFQVMNPDVARKKNDYGTLYSKPSTLSIQMIIRQWARHTEMP